MSFWHTCKYPEFEGLDAFKETLCLLADARLIPDGTIHVHIPRDSQGTVECWLARPWRKVTVYWDTAEQSRFQSILSSALTKRGTP